MRRSSALWVFIAWLAVTPALAQPAGQTIDGPPPPDLPDVIARRDDGQATVRTMRLPSPQIFDGRLDEVFYTNVRSFGDFIQQDPFEGQPASKKTEVWVFFDDANLYVSARMWESNRGTRVANEMRRDSFNLYNNDHFAVLFDTFYDRRSGYSFYVNPLGGLADSQLVNEQFNPNVRFRWEYQPGSEMFVVYSDGRDTDGKGFPPPISNRSVVVKVTKLFRL